MKKLINITEENIKLIEEIKYLEKYMRGIEMNTTQAVNRAIYMANIRLWAIAERLIEEGKEPTEWIIEHSRRKKK